MPIVFFNDKKIETGRWAMTNTEIIELAGFDPNDLRDIVQVDQQGRWIGEVHDGRKLCAILLLDEMRLAIFPISDY